MLVYLLVFFCRWRRRQWLLMHLLLTGPFSWGLGGEHRMVNERTMGYTFGVDLMCFT